MLKAFGILLACFLAGGALAGHCGAARADEVYRYDIRDGILGTVGSYRVVRRRDGATTIETARTEIDAFFGIFSYESDTRSEWRHGRLVAYSSRTRDDDDWHDVTAVLDGDVLRVDGHEDHDGVAPPDVQPVNAITPRLRAAGTVIEPKKGRLWRVETHAAGAGTIPLPGGAVRADRYEMTGEFPQTLWYRDDLLVQSRFEMNGRAVTFRYNPIGRSDPAPEPPQEPE